LAEVSEQDWDRTIGVNTVCPGMIRTAMIENAALAHPEMLTTFEAITPQGRLGLPDEVAGAMLWLCSKAASYVNGHSLLIDGAYVAQ